MKLSVRRFATWLALLSVSLYALWPLLATAQPRGDGDKYELCPHAALQHLAEKNGHEKPSSNPIWDNHLLRCAFGLNTGDGASATPTGPIVLFIHRYDSETNVVSQKPVALSTTPTYATAPRGPPAAS